MARGNGWEMPEEVLCREPGDFFRPAARKAMAHLCRNQFDGLFLTPLCFLHSPFHQRRLYEGGELLGAFQMAAVAQSKLTGQPFRERQRELVAMFDRVVARCREKSRLFEQRRIRASEFPDLVERIRGRIEDPADRNFAMNCVVSFHLENVKSWLAKAHKLIGLYRPDLDPDTVALLDAHLAEIVSGRTALTELVGGDGGVDAAAIALIDLWDSVGDTDPAATPELGEVVTGTATLAALRILVGSGGFPETRDAIADHLVAMMDSNRPFRVSDRESELDAVHRVFSRFRAADDALRGRLHEAIGRRIGRTLTEDNVRRFRETEPQALRLIDKLLLFHRYAGNRFQRQAIEDELDRLFEDPDLYDQLLREGGNLDEKLRAFSRLAERIHGLSIEAFRKLTVTKTVARMQMRFVREYRYFETIFEAHTDVLALSRMLLDMFKTRVFLTGPCREGAKRVIKQLLAGKAFQTAYLADATSDAEAAERVRVLRDELESVGLID